MAPTFLLIASLVACGDATQSAVVDYQRTMAPVLQKNSALGKEFMTMASRVKSGQLDAKATADQFEASAVPAAQDLASAVAAVQPTDAALAAEHQRLVKAWASRAESYTAMAVALDSGNLVAFEAAQARELQVRLDEMAWQDAVNRLAAPYGAALHLYP